MELLRLALALTAIGLISGSARLMFPGTGAPGERRGPVAGQDAGAEGGAGTKSSPQSAR